MLNLSEISAVMSRTGNYARRRSSATPIEEIGVVGLVAVGIVRQNVVQKVGRMLIDSTVGLSIVEPSSKSQTRRPNPNH